MVRYQRIISSLEDKDKLIDGISTQMGISRLISELLINRGITSPDKARDFLFPQLNQLHDPFLLKDMDRAIERITKAIQCGENITIYGDYDVDGVTSTSLLLLYLRSLGANVDFYIPSRHKEGYGLNKPALERIARNGTDLLITVDCGISAYVETEYGKSIGLDMIITDHHDFTSQLPDCIAVINPKRTDQKYPFSFLAGVGVAAKLIHALGGIEAVKNYLDIIAIGTVADVVPLSDENRVFVKFGLDLINDRPRLGIKELTITAGLESREIDSDSIAFGIAPRINAGGRMAHSSKSVKLLTTDDFELAKEISLELNDENKGRQEIESLIFTQALSMVENEVDLTNDRLILLHHSDWHHGVVGIVASRLVERFYRPVILLSSDGEFYTGSGRSIPGVNLYESLYSCKSLFRRFGGHEQAVGLSIAADHIDDFKSQVNHYLKTNFSPDIFIPRMYYDRDLSLSDIDFHLIDELSLLHPFGAGNPKPVFRTCNVMFEYPRMIGKERNHLKLNLLDGQSTLEGIGFKMGYALEDIMKQSKFDILFQPTLNEWNGRMNIQCHLQSFRAIKTVENLNKQFDSNKDKLFSAFLEQIIYNNDVPDAFLSDIQLTDQREGIETSLIHALRQDIQGTLVIVHTKQGLIRLIQMLEEHILIEHADFYFQTLKNNSFGYNAIMLVSDLEKINLDRYDRIFLFDGFLTAGYLYHVYCKAVNKKIFASCSEHDVLNTQSLLMPIKLSREELGSYFRLFRTITINHDYFVSYDAFFEQIMNTSSFHILDWKVKMALRIFEELEFLIFEEKDNFVLRLNPNLKQRDLNESHLFQSITQIQDLFLHNIRNMQNYLSRRKEYGSKAKNP